MRFDLNGIEIAARRPTNAELTPVCEVLVKERSLTHEAARDLCKALVPKAQYDQVMKRRPAAFRSIGALILENVGFGIVATVLEEDEIGTYGADFAKAYVDKTSESEKLYEGVNDADDMRRVFAVIVDNDEGDPTRLLLRFPKEREVSAAIKSASVDAAEGFVRKLTLWGSLDRFHEAPGAWFSLQQLMVEQAGASEVRLLGK